MQGSEGALTCRRDLPGTQMYSHSSVCGFFPLPQELAYADVECSFFPCSPVLREDIPQIEPGEVEQTKHHLSVCFFGVDPDGAVGRSSHKTI